MSLNAFRIVCRWSLPTGSNSPVRIRSIFGYPTTQKWYNVSCGFCGQSFRISFKIKCFRFVVAICDLVYCVETIHRLSSLQCYSILSDIWVKIELCIPLESESSILSTCNAFVCLSPPSKLKFAVLFCSICKGLISFSAILF